MVTRARFTADLVSTVNANTSSPANAIFISSAGDVTIANSITVGGNIPGFVQNSYVHATFAQNTSTINLFDDRLQVANAAAAYVTKAVHMTSNNALVNLINDRLQIANADATYVTKAVALSSNTALVGLINDRLQVANLTSELSTYWPSANAIAYINANAGASDMTVNTSIFVASGGETSFAIPVTSNTNLVEVVLNGYELTRSIDWTANSTHIKGIEALAAGDIVQVHEYKLHPANTLNRSAGGGGGGSWQGTTSGYAYGGTPYFSQIEKFSIASDTNAVQACFLASPPLAAFGQNSASPVGQKSPTHAYMSGGNSPGGVCTTVISFPFASDANGSPVGNLSAARAETAGHSSSTHGYTSGGYASIPPSGVCNIIDKFPFTSPEGTATDVGNLTTARYSVSDQQSSTHGYVSTGSTGYDGVFPYATPYSNVIDKFPFASDANATDVGDITCIRLQSAGQSSTTHGYVSGGVCFSALQNIIDKFPFASDANASDVGDLVAVTRGSAGISSTTAGYAYAGATPSSPNALIQKFPFSSDTNATDVADPVTASRRNSSGSQI